MELKPHNDPRGTYHTYVPAAGEGGKGGERDVEGDKAKAFSLL